MILSSLSTRSLDHSLHDGTVRQWIARRLRHHSLDWMPLEVPALTWLTIRRHTAAANDADYLAPFITHEDE